MHTSLGKRFDEATLVQEELGDDLQVQSKL